LISDQRENVKRIWKTEKEKKWQQHQEPNILICQRYFGGGKMATNGRTNIFICQRYFEGKNDKEPLKVLIL
jgi:hypothetical protein